ncbi:GNAT family N-acetyltransferase [Paenibacillus sedimenti]|uniref:GNAT family N-acetyltransferase n=1 Tax=Paenibacillus sedimenti TaxID=2770274 RepID=A0A926QI35_9BACL|nr:GNAT family N-acetyltransferase [Paenibacillus sedimenti]MBD0380095.1 GNAT family N-acetyltransferase [Paenibacillus sedimenti]
MKNGIEIIEVKAMNQTVLNNLSELLIAVVEDGASIGFLPPLILEDAVTYWQEVVQPGVHLWIAVNDGRMIGTVQLHLALKQNAGHRAEIAKLMVHPLGRRKGIARLLMQIAEEQAKEAGRSLLVLDTRSGDPSNHLYRSTGYIEAGRIPNYARSNDGKLHDTIIYFKQI